nr:hypothetical protein CFP56_37358 [Quercus suber]
MTWDERSIAKNLTASYTQDVSASPSLPPEGIQKEETESDYSLPPYLGPWTQRICDHASSIEEGSAQNSPRVVMNGAPPERALSVSLKSNRN